MSYPLLETQVRWQYQLLNHDGNLSRVRCHSVNDGRTVSEARIRGINELIEWAKEFNGHGNLFIGRNPVSETGKVCRITSWSLDIDPVRAPKSASSEDQHLNALRIGNAIRQRYGDGGISSSGNGCLLLFPIAGIDIQHLQQFQTACRLLEDEIRKEFETSEVKIDATYDVARLVKLLGSKSVKGDPRLWRYAKFTRRPVFRAVRSPILERIKGNMSPKSESVVGLETPTVNTPPTNLLAVDGGGSRLGPADRLRLAEQSLKRINPVRADDYNDWLRCGIALKEFGPAGLGLWREWSRHSSKYREGDCENKWSSFREEQAVTVGTLKHWADTDDPGRGRDAVGERGTSTGTQLWTPGQPYRSGSNRREGQDSGNLGVISTGFKWLDSKLNGGYRPGVVYGCEAVTNAGKSTFIVSTARHICERGKRVLLVTTESSIEEVCERYWAAGTGLSTASISNGSLDNDGIACLGEYQRQFRETHQLGVWYTTSPRTAEIEAQIEAFKPDIVLWDYFQHFETGTDSRQVQLGSLARWFESTAIKYSIPFVVAAQLHERYDFKTRKKMPSIKDDIKDCKTLNDVCKTIMVLDWSQLEQTTEDGPALVRLSLDKNKGPMSETKILLKRNIPVFEEI